MGRDSSTLRQLFCSFIFLSFVLALFGASCWWLLKSGISVEHLAVGGADIRQLSLRLDQGLVLHIGRLDLAGGDGADRAAGWEARMPFLKKWGHLIQEVDISRLTYGGYTAAIAYRAGRFRVRSEQLSVDAALSYSDKTLWLNLIDLQILPYRFTVTGHASYSAAQDRLLFAGRFVHPLASGSLWLGQQAGQVEAAISTEEFPELVPVLAQFPMDPQVTTWVAENISAASYRIRDLRFRFNLQKLQDFGPEDISGTAVADAVAIRFDPELEPVRCDRVHITYAGDRLSFALDNPQYREKSLQGSSVYIDNVVAEGSTLGIDLMAKTGKDKIVDEILDQYDINFPARQISGTTRVDLRLLFDLSDFTMAVGGSIRSGPGAWVWRDITLQTSGAALQLVNHQVLITRADLAVTDKFRANLTGFIDTRTLHGDLQSEIDFLTVATAEATVLQATGLRTPLSIDFSQGVILVNLPEMRTSLRVGPERTDIDVDSLRSVAPFVPLLQKLSFTEGRVQLSVADPNYLQFAGEIDVPNSLLSLQDQPVSQFSFQGASTPERTEIAMNDNNILVSWTDSLAVNLNGYLFTVDADDYSRGEEFSTPFPLKIIGSRSLLKIKEEQIATGMFEFRAKNSDLSFRAELEQGNFVYESTPAGKSFVGRGLDAALVDNFLKNADLTDGTMNIVLKGKPGNFEGYLEMNNILIKDTKLLNNILAFLNAVPALATLSSPGFDPDGYRVNEGVMYVHYRDNILTIDELRTDGVTINTEAQGWINHSDRTLQLTMELIALKDYSWILEKIPLAGYAILGENGSLSTSLDIQGSIDDPEITTNLTREILMSPINIIKRTIAWPFRLLEKFSSSQDEDVPKPE
jgi:AsmA-like C-terminal region/Protein of unknown function